MTQKCYICGIDDVTDVCPVTDRRKGWPGNWKVWVCHGCGVLFLGPQPNQEELKRCYAAYASAVTSHTVRRICRWQPILRNLIHRFTGDVDPRDFVKVTPGIQMLDYGCATGVYMFEFKDRGALVSGIDLSDEAVRYCIDHGLNVKTPDNVETVPFEDDTFDVIYLMQVFEHLSNPIRVLQELKRVLRSSGRVYLAMPNAKSFWRRLFRKNWVSGWFAPYHLFHYDLDAIKRIAEGGGFHVTSSWTSTPDSWFRLNLKAVFNPTSNRLDSLHSYLDASPIRIFIILMLRAVELFVKEKDCLIVTLERR